MAISRWPSLHRQHTSPTNNERTQRSQTTPLPSRRNHVGIQLPHPSFLNRFKRKSLPTETTTTPRRLSAGSDPNAHRGSADADRNSIMMDLEVVFDSEEGMNDGDQTHARTTPRRPPVDDNEYRYWRLQGRSGRRNAEVGTIRKDWSSIPSPFTSQPKIVDAGHYIERPTYKRTYYEQPNASSLSTMVDPYPTLRRQQAGHSFAHDDIDISISPYRSHQQQRRHSLSWGKMDKIISENKGEHDTLRRVDTFTSTSTAGTGPGTLSRQWDSVRRLMKGKTKKMPGDKKGKSRVIDLDLAPPPHMLDQDHSEDSSTDHPTIKILVQEPTIHFISDSPVDQTNDFLNVHRSTSPYDADIDSIDDRASHTSQALSDSKEL
ncbi:hypothetical protein K450DRAFT_296299 [Umbelopsis ramanniana AG]|uniref:Uncharacterized protein n=1 Tax=Umbelopsis ramanniana AG TaxID=1314678 RepID=A0AAD5EIN6_UMBRA|nr:uncharacterized protein K450DRAFT_296299 [Umbelopsis ramanniana AG]KAI8584122.1 hypothetical protein K450DRAFT_296299 [Umbelopsis ramanniana AG]